jgi:tetratricopeptide (TPR) repeat protein
MFERLSVMVEEHDGRDSIAYARVLHGMSSCISRAGNFEESDTLDREALAITERRVGENHPVVAPLLNGIAVNLVRHDREAEALPYHERALRIRREALGDDHPFVAQSHGNMAWALAGVDRLEEAEFHFREALSIREQTLGAEHPANTFDLTGLARVLNLADRPAEAVPLLERAIEIGRDAQTSALFVSETRYMLAHALVASGERARGIRIARRARKEMLDAGDEDYAKRVSEWLRTVEPPDTEASE